MGNIGNLSGIGKMENGGGSKLYCVTISNKYSFYSSVQITNVQTLRNYLQDKQSVRLFGVVGSYTSTECQIRSYTIISYLNTTNFVLYYHVSKIQFSNGAYTGGSDTSIGENTSYNSISNYINCTEV